MTKVEKLMELLPYWMRPLRYCEGVACYVKTANRKDGRPYCHACKEEGNHFKTKA